ncbi:carboxyesterase [Mucidula mucida]|nr:carboxyesterase [Mucidula mucida]
MPRLSFLALTVTLLSSPTHALTQPPVSRATLTSSFGPVVDLGYAAFAGNDTLDGVIFYGGIPYIQPPVGDLRFAPPQAIDETPRTLWPSDVIDARNWGPICIQQPAVVGIGAEDCVTLNVWTPPGASNLPVYVYIHGGGYYYNSAQWFPGNTWVSRSDGGLVVVGIQYRLGLLGFLAGETVINYSKSSVNNGLLDQRAALEWIQRNIAAFGGDPAKVTIGGESAGGGAVALHLTAYGGETYPPFRAAVIESAGNDPFYTDDRTETCFSAVTAFVGCDSARDVMACWRSTSISTLIAAVNNKPSSCKFLPIIDGDYVPGVTSALLAAGNFSKVPILAGHTAQDGAIFVGKPAAVTTDAQIKAAVVKRYTTLSDDTLNAMLVTYPPADDTTPWTTQWERAMYAYMESELGCWDYYIGNISGQVSFNYRWDAPDPTLLVSRGDYVGAAHTSELFYLFDGTNSGPSASVAQPVFTAFDDSEAALAKKAIAWWSSFAMTLDPNTHAAVGAPEWVSADKGGFMAAGLNSSAMVDRTDNYPERCAWWRSVGEELRL